MEAEAIARVLLDRGLRRTDPFVPADLVGRRSHG
jgi:hypothetical protein